MSEKDVSIDMANLLDEVGGFNQKMKECLKKLLEMQLETELLIAKMLHASNRKRQIMQLIQEKK